MNVERIVSALKANQSKHYFKYVLDGKTKNCANCLRLDGEIFAEDDGNKPILPLHPNCDCRYVEVSEREFLRQQNFQFGTMNPDKWIEQSDDDKNLWCNSFRKQFGDCIDKYSIKYNVPKQLLAGIIANEMIDWKWPDGSFFDGLGGGGVGYAQIAPKTAQQQGIVEKKENVSAKLKSIEGSVELAARLLRKYLDELKARIATNSLGEGFKKSPFYYKANPNILSGSDIVNMSVPEWLLNTMCAVWNSGIEVLDAKDAIGDRNYSNAHIHGLNSSMLSPYLSKLIKE